jgi:hypothetical protein
MTDQDASPDSSAAQTEDRERIGKALDTLSDDHRTIIMLSDVEGLAYREIAEVLDIPIGTVMSRLHNARKRLRGALKPLLAAVVTLLLACAGGVALAQGSAQAPPANPAAATVHFGARVYLATDGPPPTTAPDLPDEPRVERYVRSSGSCSGISNIIPSSTWAPMCRWGPRTTPRWLGTGSSS